MTAWRTIAGALAGIVAAATLAATTANTAPQDLPTFRGGVQMIDVDVVVTDRDGNPVRDLTREDFEIVEHGKSQTIRTFSLIDLPFEEPAALAARRAREVERDVVTNTAPEGRTYVLLVDGGATVDLKARHVAERWLDEAVQPFDRVAVVHMHGTYKDAQTFTSSRRLILDSIDRMIWGSGSPGVQAPLSREVEKWHAIRALSERLGTIPGRRKAIVWLGDPGTLWPLAGYSSGKQAFDDPIANGVGHILAAWREAAQTAVHNNVAIYPVDPSGLGSGLIASATMREVAEETGGVAIVNTNNFSGGFRTIVQDAGTYYLLGYTPEPEQTDGDFHSISVRVRRDGVTVRARRGYYAPSPNARPPKPLPEPPNGVSLEARDALLKPVATQGLGVDVATTAFKGNGKDASIVITAHVRGKTLDFDKGRRLAVSYQVFDVDGKVASGFYKVFGFNLGDASKARATGTGLQFVERISLKPGRYELRLVAEQPDGPIGSVVSTIVAGKFEDDLELSGVSLASRRANEVLLVGDRSLRNLLSDDATALRRFRASDGLSAYAEVYTRLDDLDYGVRYDLVPVATLASSVTNSAGAVVASGKVQKVRGDAAGKSLREGFRTDVDLSKLTPGSYVLTLEARGRNGKKPVTRQIPFMVE